MITGSHVIVYSRDADAERAFFSDVLDYPHLDAGGGWLIFKLPPGEVAEHLAAKGVACSEVTDQGWGLLTSIRLPGGGDLGLYEPRHPRATEL